MKNKTLIKEIMGQFEKIAPEIVIESIEKSTSDHPKIDLYDEDFYLDQIRRHFPDTGDQILRGIIMENKIKIDNIFLKHYRNQSD